MDIAQHLKALRDSRQTAFDKQAAIGQKSVDDDRSLSTDEQKSFDDLQGEIDSFDADIARFEKMLATEQASAAPVEKSAGQPGHGFRTSVKDVQAENGLAFAQYVRTLYEGGGNKHVAMQIAEQKAASGLIDKRIPLHMKAAVSGATTTDASWAGNLVHESNVVADFVSYLRDRTILGQFGQGNIPALRTAPADVPIDVQDSAASAGWVGEGKAKPLTSWGYSTKKLEEFKLASIAVISDELLRKATSAADAMLRDELVRAIAETEDKTFIDPANSGTAGVKPASILNGASTQASDTTSGATGAEQFEADFAWMVGKLITAKIPFSGVTMIMSSSNAFALSRVRDSVGNRLYPNIGITGGSIDGVPVMTSDYIGDEVALLSASNIYLVDGGGIEVAQSSEASLEMSDAPTGDATAGTGASLVSMFQTNSVAFRVEERTGWARRRSAAVAYVTAADYSTANA